MINAVTVTMDLQTLDPELPGRLMLMQPLTPGSARTVPGGVMVFQAACLNSEAGEPSLYRFVIQFGAAQAVAAVGNWLFSQLHGTAAALQIGGFPVPIGHHSIIAALRRVG
jgi:hypothetical protein